MSAAGEQARGERREPTARLAHCPTGHCPTAPLPHCPTALLPLATRPTRPCHCPRPLAHSPLPLPTRPSPLRPTGSLAACDLNRYAGEMNFLSHALPYLDRPLLAVSTGIPDWLSVVDRKIRARGRMAQTFLDSADPELSLVAQGIVRHIEDDRWFHGTEAFVDTNMRLAIELRELLPGDAGFRPTFVAHILIEMLLDSFWIRDDRDNAERYYEAIEAVGFEDDRAMCEHDHRQADGSPFRRDRAICRRPVLVRLPRPRQTLGATEPGAEPSRVDAAAWGGARLASRGQEDGRIAASTAVACTG